MAAKPKTHHFLLPHLSLPPLKEGVGKAGDSWDLCTLLTTGKKVPVRVDPTTDVLPDVVEAVNASFTNTYRKKLECGNKWNSTFISNVNHILGMIRHVISWVESDLISAADRDFWSAIHKTFAALLASTGKEAPDPRNNPLGGLQCFIQVHFGGSKALNAAVWQKAFPGGKHQKVGLLLYRVLVGEFYRQFLESVELLGIIYSLVTKSIQSGDRNLILSFMPIWTKCQLKRSTKLTDIARALRSFTNYRYHAFRTLDPENPDVLALMFNASKIPLFFVFLEHEDADLYHLIFTKQSVPVSGTALKKWWRKLIILPAAVMSCYHFIDSLSTEKPEGFPLEEFAVALEDFETVGRFWTVEDVKRLYQKEQPIAAPKETKEELTKETPTEEVVESLKVIATSRNQQFEERVNKMFGSLHKEMASIEEKSEQKSKSLEDAISAHKEALDKVKADDSLGKLVAAHEALKSSVHQQADGIKALEASKESKESIQKLASELRKEIKNATDAVLVEALENAVKYDKSITPLLKNTVVHGEKVEKLEKDSEGYRKTIGQLSEGVTSLLARIDKLEKKPVTDFSSQIKECQHRIGEVKDSFEQLMKAQQNLEQLVKTSGALQKTAGPVGPVDDDALATEIDELTQRISNLAN